MTPFKSLTITSLNNLYHTCRNRVNYETWAVQWHTIGSFVETYMEITSRKTQKGQQDLFNSADPELHSTSVVKTHPLLSLSDLLSGVCVFVWSLVIRIPTFLDKYLCVQGAEAITVPESVYVPWRGSRWLDWFSLEMRCNTIRNLFIKRAGCVKIGWL